MSPPDKAIETLLKDEITKLAEHRHAEQRFQTFIENSIAENFHNSIRLRHNTVTAAQDAHGAVQADIARLRSQQEIQGIRILGAQNEAEVERLETVSEEHLRQLNQKDATITQLTTENTRLTTLNTQISTNLQTVNTKLLESQATTQSLQNQLSLPNEWIEKAARAQAENTIKDLTVAKMRTQVYERQGLLNAMASSTLLKAWTLSEIRGEVGKLDRGVEGRDAVSAVAIERFEEEFLISRLNKAEDRDRFRHHKARDNRRDRIEDDGFTKRVIKAEHESGYIKLD